MTTPYRHRAPRGNVSAMNGRSEKNPWLVGVDGCRGGWLATFVRASGDDYAIAVFPRFADIAAITSTLAEIAVDMPIGLPARTGIGGRAAENAVRPLFGARRSSVFSVPSRAAIGATDYVEACRIARKTSHPPRAVSRQLFNIAQKIREVDTALRADTALASQTFEVHPEVAFWRLNGERPLAEPKKVKSRPYSPGLAIRRGLLEAAGLPLALVHGTPPRGAAEDDLIDALACAAIARRIHRGKAVPFPDPAPRDEFGLPMAIWA
jgi:predicted RNase H-like nuclease